VPTVTSFVGVLQPELVHVVFTESLMDRQHGVVHGSLSSGAPVPAMKNH
jgi:hypothetical protein